MNDGLAQLRSARKRRLSSCSKAIAVALAASATGAMAQTPENGDVLTEIVVTGSRIERSGFETPSPLTVLGAEELQKSGVTNVADQLVKIPSFQGSDMPQSIGTSSQRDPTAGYLNLRGMGANRTLVLVDGKRHVPSAASGTVDTNLIPFALIQRTEVVTGGASAAYGSDAVAGVVNFIINPHFEGVKVNAQAGMSELGDDKRESLSIAAGHDFMDGRLNLAFAGQYFHNGDTLPVGERDWGKDDWKLLTNPDYTPTNGQYRLIAAPHSGFSVATHGGLILEKTGPLHGLQFGPGGTVYPFTYGTAVGNTFMIGGDYDEISATATMTPLEVERKNAYGRIGYQITDNVSATFEATVANSFGRTRITRNTDVGAGGKITIFQDNAFLPDEVRQIMIDNDIESFRMGRLNPELGFIEPVTDTDLQRYVLSFDGEFGDGWSWSVYGESGKTRFNQIYITNRNQVKWGLAVDAVRAPDGSIVCRSTLTDPDNGCIPANVFGDGSLNSTDVASYVLQNPYSTTWSQEQAAGATLNGEPFNSWAGPVSIAVGAEWRREHSKTIADPESNQGIFRVGNKTDQEGQFSVKEAFLETVVPLAKDAQFARSLDLNAAARLTDYSTSGSVTTWKVGISYEPFETIRLRAARSRDIRAPNIVELFDSGHLNSGGTVIDRATGIQYAPRTRGGGNPDLDPEEADTLTYGIVWSPVGALSGLRASLDLYTIDLEKAIGTFSSQNIIDYCQRGNQSLCARIERDASGAITLVNQTYVNLGYVKTSGADVEVAYNMALAQHFDHLRGNIDMRLLGSWVDKYEQNDGTDNVVDLAGALDRPDWKLSARVTYTNGPLRVYAEDQYVPSLKMDATFTAQDIADNQIDSQNIVNASIAYNFGTETDLEVYATVNNLFNVDPPLVPSSGVTGFPTDLSLFDTLGRRYQFGVRLSF